MSFIPYPHTLTFPGFKKEALGVRRAQVAVGAPAILPFRSTYAGTIKVHGTNISLVFRDSDAINFTVQSRNKTIVPGPADNAGAAGYLTTVPNISTLVSQIFRVRGTPAVFSTLIIAGEWAGKGIQKGAGVCELPHFFYIYNISIDGVWVEMLDYASVSMQTARIFNAYNFPSFRVQLDLRDHTVAYKQMLSHTTAVFEKCPVAAALGGSGHGEGIVWTMLTNGRYPMKKLMSFKTKAAEFSVTSKAPRVKPQSSANEIAKQFVQYAVGKLRLEQGMDYMQEMGYPIKRQNAGTFSKWVTDDAVREERATMKEMGAEESLVRSKVSEMARKYWLEECVRQGV